MGAFGHWVYTVSTETTMTVAGSLSRSGNPLAQGEIGGQHRGAPWWASGVAIDATSSTSADGSRPSAKSRAEFSLPTGR